MKRKGKKKSNTHSRNEQFGSFVRGTYLNWDCFSLIKSLTEEELKGMKINIRVTPSLNYYVNYNRSLKYFLDIDLYKCQLCGRQLERMYSYIMINLKKLLPKNFVYLCCDCNRVFLDPNVILSCDWNRRKKHYTFIGSKISFYGLHIKETDLLNCLKIIDSEKRRKLIDRMIKVSGRKRKWRELAKSIN